MPTAFANEPILELRRASVRAGLDDALARVDARLPVRVPTSIGEDARDDGPELLSTDPGCPERAVAVAAAAGGDDVRAAVGTAAEG
ncbi:MAG: hypothetical protein ACRDNJ_11610, partial [Solirubrobacteraceae bacterium]